MAAGQQRAHAAAAAPDEHSLECRRFEVAGVAVDIRQDLKGSNALRPLDDDRVWAGDEGEEVGAPILTAEDLSRVGLVVWQAGFVLADLLLRRPPFGSWHGAQVLDLGCGTGLVGMLLALAGAEVTLTDQPHIVPLAEANAKANLTPGLHRWRVVPYTWGQGDAAGALAQSDAAAALLPPAPAPDGSPAGGGADTSGGPEQRSGCGSAAASLLPPVPSYDVITAADVVYQPESYALLAATLRALAAPHTLVYIAFKRRGLQEDSFLSLLEASGFAQQEVPAAQLAPEYREGDRYCVVRACRIE